MNKIVKEFGLFVGGCAAGRLVEMSFPSGAFEAGVRADVLVGKEVKDKRPQVWPCDEEIPAEFFSIVERYVDTGVRQQSVRFSNTGREEKRILVLHERETFVRLSSGLRRAIRERLSCEAGQRLIEIVVAELDARATEVSA